MKKNIAAIKEEEKRAFICKAPTKRESKKTRFAAAFPVMTLFEL